MSDFCTCVFLHILLSIFWVACATVDYQHFDEETEPVDLEYLQHDKIKAVQCEEDVELREMGGVRHRWTGEDVEDPEWKTDESKIEPVGHHDEKYNDRRVGEMRACDDLDKAGGDVGCQMEPGNDASNANLIGIGRSKD